MGGGKVDQAINYSTQLEVISHPITGESSEMRFKSDPEVIPVHQDDVFICVL